MAGTVTNPDMRERDTQIQDRLRRRLRVSTGEPLLALWH